MVRALINWIRKKRGPTERPQQVPTGEKVDTQARHRHEDRLGPRSSHKHCTPSEDGVQGRWDQPPTLLPDVRPTKIQRGAALVARRTEREGFEVSPLEGGLVAPADASPMVVALNAPSRIARCAHADRRRCPGLLVIVLGYPWA
jgi:hypothetical protein